MTPEQRPAGVAAGQLTLEASRGRAPARRARRELEGAEQEGERQRQRGGRLGRREPATGVPSSHSATRSLPSASTLSAVGAAVELGRRRRRGRAAMSLPVPPWMLSAPLPPREAVVASATVDSVVAGAAVERVVAVAAEASVVAVAARRRGCRCRGRRRAGWRSTLPIERVVAGAAGHALDVGGDGVVLARLALARRVVVRREVDGDGRGAAGVASRVSRPVSPLTGGRRRRGPRARRRRRRRAATRRRRRRSGCRCRRRRRGRPGLSTLTVRRSRRRRRARGSARGRARRRSCASCAETLDAGGIERGRWSRRGRRRRRCRRGRAGPRGRLASPGSAT